MSRQGLAHRLRVARPGDPLLHAVEHDGLRHVVARERRLRPDRQTGRPRPRLAAAGTARRARRRRSRASRRADAGAAVDERVKADMIALWCGRGGGRRACGAKWRARSSPRSIREKHRNVVRTRANADVSRDFSPASAEKSREKVQHRSRDRDRFCGSDTPTVREPFFSREPRSPFLPRALSPRTHNPPHARAFARKVRLAVVRTRARARFLARLPRTL